MAVSHIDDAVLSRQLRQPGLTIKISDVILNHLDSTIFTWNQGNNEIKQHDAGLSIYI
jgi:hypothetical protein